VLVFLIGASTLFLKGATCRRVLQQGRGPRVRHTHLPVSSLLAIALLIAGLALVIGGAETFLDGLLGSAARFRTSPFVLAVLVSGLEVENLAAGIAADVKGLPGGAAGTFLGGTTFLALGVAGVAALIAPMQAKLPGRIVAWTAAAPLPLLVLSLDQRLSRLDGMVLVVWFVVAMVGLVRAGRGVVQVVPTRGVRFPVARMLAGLALLTGGGELLGVGLRRVVSNLNISATFLGNTAIAASVEAEEIARVVTPARRGRGELGLGNVAGTIVHFVALNAGVIAIVKPLRLDADSVHLHLPVAVGAVAAFSLLVWRRRGLTRRDGIALCGLYLAYLAAAVVVATS
jgi:cation:H+ antiporter